jgi:hypothetical protein
MHAGAWLLWKLHTAAVASCAGDTHRAGVSPHGRAYPASCQTRPVKWEQHTPDSHPASCADITSMLLVQMYQLLEALLNSMG